VPHDVELADASGESLSHFLDGKRPVVLVLAYSRCRMLCSVVLRNVVQAVRATPGDFAAIAVSIDRRETREEAGRHEASLGPPWHYLVGDAEPLARALGFRYAWDPRTEQYAHPAAVFVLTPDGRLAETLRGVTYDRLGDAIVRAARGQIAGSDETNDPWKSSTEDILRCFHFDPALRRYGDRIALFFRLGAATVLLGLLAMLGALVWRRR
jgi:protein SCO1/2